jgi:hypothetical protein
MAAIAGRPVPRPGPAKQNVAFDTRPKAVKVADEYDAKLKNGGTTEIFIAPHA